MEVIIKINGQALSVEVSVEVYEFLDRADHKEENLSHEQRRHWDIREFDEYIVTTEGRTYQEIQTLIKSKLSTQRSLAFLFFRFKSWDFISNHHLCLV